MFNDQYHGILIWISQGLQLVTCASGLQYSWEPVEEVEYCKKLQLKTTPTNKSHRNIKKKL